MLRGITVEITFRAGTPVFNPGGRIHGIATLHSQDLSLLDRVDTSIYWQTTGHARQESQVIYLHSPLIHTQIQGTHHFPFAADLPCLPLTYNGFLIKISWHVRVWVHQSGVGEGGLILPFIVQSSSPEE